MMDHGFNVDPAVFTVHRMKVGLLANHYCALTPAEVLAPAVDRRGTCFLGSLS